ncbi:hypothetical protein HYDPIDRAFT_24400 [Hydnomerulius pinastri MD-312]|nr:hypothetical protein HYDPIDRAFT_24400 [Hydnomerulius pinastri MD-312]
MSDAPNINQGNEPPRGSYYIVHPVLDGTPCDVDGHDLSPDAGPPSLPHPRAGSPWYPFSDQAHFELADFIVLL